MNIKAPTLVPEFFMKPREAAEYVLGHPKNFRSQRVIYNMTKQIQSACRLWASDPECPDCRFFGIPHKKHETTGRVRIKLCEVLAWAERRDIPGWRELLEGSPHGPRRY